MKGFKSTDSRLAKLFNNSRDKWKKRVAEKQKKMRGMEIKIRDLSASRELWKEKALVAQEQQDQLERELEEFKKKLNTQNQQM
jgi:hypothetical protein